MSPTLASAPTVEANCPAVAAAFPAIQRRLSSLSPRDWGRQGSTAHTRREADGHGARIGGAVGAAGAAGSDAGLRLGRAGGLAGQPRAPPLPRLAQAAPAGPAGGHAEEAGLGLTA
ncbi:hypothetical protein Y1Q_0008531 [Alligator mississippiensis]|uniref:Uncharacterized protein n=1 Tax=Alligator mississippiensis TaxID=8496 RepID=A0A151M1M6_ALLMI|nr:hypothetical protein Y1Q_0008531 [Alligator mississippiensis]